MASGRGPLTTFSSPNHNERRARRGVHLVVIHATRMVDAASARARLCDPAAEVSAHWLIDEDGATEALVAEDRRAWHAGAGCWRGEEDVNSRSIGVELANPMDRPFAAPQMLALEGLLRAILVRHNLPPCAVIAHSDMAPQRKDDPGPRFDWARLARQGLALSPAPARPGDEAQPFASSLDAIGYPAAPAEARLGAFRLRHRPHAFGPESAADRALAARVARAVTTGMPRHKRDRDA